MAFRSPNHALDTVTFTCKLPTADNDVTTTLHVAGSADTKRTRLWTWEETWTKEESNDGLCWTDTLRWWALIASQDRPRDQATWNRQITGRPWGEQLELF
uniref:Uncharacterized protein n=1 Tax=uncultured prokaryote TaxID=198431 RepID=A0A0H5Q3Y6_9ZZZZ|nr:hypothetical protein [uncultured prokaryote]